MKFSSISNAIKLATLFSASALTSITSSAQVALEAEAQVQAKTDYIRVHKTEKEVFLQTGITRFTKEDIIIDFIGAVHIADQKYYEDLNKVFTNYDSLLFEMIGGENIQEQLKQLEQQQAEKKDTQLDFLSGMYNKLTKKLDLTGQIDGIDYSKDNFIHADLSLKEFNDLQEQKDESIFKFAFKSAVENAKQQKGKVTKQPSTIKLLKTLFFGSPDDLKLILVESLGSGDDQIQSIAGDSVIIGDRNIKCLKVMNDQIAEGKKHLGIFYGAAHFPDMEMRIKKMGFKQTNHKWVNAWTVKKESKQKKQPAPSE